MAARLAGADTGGRLRLVPLQRALDDRPEVRRLAAQQDLSAALHVIDGEGRWAAGGEAMVRAAELVPSLRPLAWLARRPLLAPFVEPGYQFVAGHRSWFGWLAGSFRRCGRRRPS